MKLPLKATYKITALACLLLLGACGKKTNSVNSGAVPAVGSSPYNTNSPLSTLNPQIATQVQNIKSSVACLYGRTRLINDTSFYVSGGAMSGTTIGGGQQVWQQGFMANGTISDLYVGVSAWRDLMFLTKVTNGGQVVGYNVTLSFCEVPNYYANYPALVSNDRALLNFQAPKGITINTATSCGYGLIAAALDTVVVSQKSANNPYTSDYPIYTSFTKPNCQ